MSKRVREMLASADPARGVQVGVGDVEALLRLAGNDITSYQAVVPPRPRPRGLLSSVQPLPLPLSSW